MNNNAYIQQLILQEIERQRQQQAQQQQGSSLGDTINKFRGYANKAQNAGNGISKIGNYLSGKDSTIAQNLGSILDKTGSAVSNTVGKVSDVLNAPQNYFKGYANKTLGQGMQNLGQSLSGESGAMETIGNALTNAQSPLLSAGNSAIADAIGSSGTSALPSTIGAAGSELGTSALGTGALGAETAGLGAGTAGLGAAAAGETAGLGSTALGSSLLGATGTAAADMGAASALSGALGAETAGAGLGALGAGTAAGTGAGLGAAGAGTAAGLGGSAAGGAMAAGPIGAIAALGIMALQGTNRKRAKQAGEQLMKATEQASQQGVQQQQNNLQQAMQNTQQLGNQQYGLDSSIGEYGLNNLSDNSAGAYNGITGGAASNNQGIINNLLSKFKQGRQNSTAANTGVLNNTAANTGTSDDDYYNDGLSTIERYQNNLRAEGYSDNVVNGVAQGLNSGIRKIADWQSQYNNGAEGRANPINIPVTPEEIAAAREGKFNTQPLTGGVSENQGLIDNLLSKFAGGLGQIAMGYQENNTQGFSPSNLTNDKFTQTTTDADGNETTKTYDKTALGRLGEAAGTTSRAAGKIGNVLKNPTAQGLIAGGLGAALTGNPLYGLGLGYKMANQRAMNDVYQDVLAKNDIETNPGMWGNLTQGDVNALMMPNYKKMQQDYYTDKLNEYKEFHEFQKNLQQQELDRKKAQDERDAKNDAFTQRIQTQKLNNETRKLNNDIKKTENTIDKDKEFAADYSQLKNILNKVINREDGYTMELFNQVKQDILETYSQKYGVEAVEKLLKGVKLE